MRRCVILFQRILKSSLGRTMHCRILGGNITARIRLSWCVVLAGMAIALLSFPAASQPAKQGAPRGHAQVYLLKGLANMSPGFDGLAAQIQRFGLPVSVHNHLMGDSLIPAIVRNYRHGQRRIILIGHSFGAGEVVSIATQLGQARIPVALLVTLDGVVDLVTPSNVRKHINYFVSDGIGHPAVRGRAARGILVNHDLKGPENGHFSITKSNRIQRQIISAVLSAAR